ncbi:hypothetical protein, partial [Klebsiella pneumoniae]|uniref:hypothetical protein n=1 Tax=Klebsiella pneumoniae TaxID=573 RepID=UPI003218385D
VWGDTASNVWAVGTGGTLLRYNGTAWAVQPSPVTTTLSAIHGTSATDIWAAGDGGRLRSVTVSPSINIRVTDRLQTSIGASAQRTRDGTQWLGNFQDSAGTHY